MSSRSSSLARFASPMRSSAARVRTRTPSPAAGAGRPARGGAQQPGDEQVASSGAVAALLRHCKMHVGRLHSRAGEYQPN